MSKTFTSKQIAEAIEGKLSGEENIQISFLGPPAIADEFTLAIAFEKDHIKAIAESKAKCFLVPEGITLEGKTYIQSNRPKLAMGRLLNLFYIPPETPVGIHPTAIIPETVKLGKNASIGPYVVIGNNTVIGDNVRILSNVNIGSSVQIGSDCLFYPCVCIGDRIKIGHKVIIHNGASIGADGFSFITEKPSNIEAARETKELGQNVQQIIIKIPSVGSVEIKDNVEIGANTTIDRGTIENTVIGKDTKIDNLVHIAHNCIIGESCFIAGQVGFSGSCKIGDRVVMAGQVGLADHLTIGNDVIIMAKSGISKNIPDKSIWNGSPALPIKQYNQTRMHIKSISDIKERLKVLEAEVLNKDKV